MSDAITIIEWGDGFVERLSDEYLEIQLSFGDEENERILKSIGHGSRWAGFELGLAK
jgi:tRNA A37 threonylcarbamoyladenosine biosynthesis protein TsaE